MVTTMISTVFDFIERPQLHVLKTLSILYRAIVTGKIVRDRERHRERKRIGTNADVLVTQRNVISHIDSEIPCVSSGVVSINLTSRPVVFEKVFSIFKTKVTEATTCYTSRTSMKVSQVYY